MASKADAKAPELDHDEALRFFRQMAEIRAFDGVACLGVPIEDAEVVHGTYTLAVPVDRLRKNRDRYLKALREAAAQALKGLSASASEGR